MNMIPTRARALILSRLTPDERKEIRDLLKSKRYVLGMVRPLIVLTIFCVIATVWQYYEVWDIAIRDVKVHDHIFVMVLMWLTISLIPATVYSVFSED